MKNNWIICLIVLSFPSFGQEYLKIQETKGVNGSHALYLELHEELPVFNRQVKINQYRFSTEKHLSTIQCEEPDFTQDLNAQVLKTQKGYLNVNNQFHLVKAITFLTPDHYSFTFYYQESNAIHYEAHQQFYSDTVVHAKVFQPDPITTSGMTYQGNFMDNNDQTNLNLDAQRFDVLVKIQHDGDTFRLENKHIKITNHSSPDIIPTALITDDFEFDRSQIGFEELNAIYHITQFAEYIKDTLKYPQIVNYQIEADVYALGNSDNSQFVNSTVPPRLSFGVGGIDDAEDADILIHEYSHAIAHSTAPGTLNGAERKALDEGLGDYFAAAYSKSLNENQYKKIFNWDGHNEFWIGRSVDNSKNYATDMENQIYKDGELYASMLMKLRNSLPDTTADRIVLESTFNWFSNMTFKDAGEALLNADTALYNGANSSIIHWVLCERGFITENCLNNSENPSRTKIKFTTINNQLQALGKHYHDNHLKIYDTGGRLVYSKLNWNNSPINLNAFSGGIYIVQLETDSISYRNRILLK